MSTISIMSVKITEDAVKSCNTNIFGDWIKEDMVIRNAPFNHCIINNFLREEEYREIMARSPGKPNKSFWKYSNPIEVKYALDKLEQIDARVYNLFLALSDEKLVSKLGKAFGIAGLQYDPYMHGAGIPYAPEKW